MTATRVFLEYYQAFERGWREGDWDDVVAVLAPDLRYSVTGSPFDCEIEGRDAVIAGLERSLGGFDRHFDQRWLGFLGLPTEQLGRVESRFVYALAKAGTPALVVAPIRIRADVRGDRIARLEDSYRDADLASAVTWLARHGAGLDASYLPPTKPGAG